MQDFNEVKFLIRKKFADTGSPARISLLKHRRGKDSFNAILRDDGIEVDNLRQYPLLTWAVFEETINLMKRLGGAANKGIVMKKGKKIGLGDPELRMDTIEGHVAHVVYGKQRGDSVFRRITPITGILIWAGICKSGRGRLILYRNITSA